MIKLLLNNADKKSDDNLSLSINLYWIYFNFLWGFKCKLYFFLFCSYIFQANFFFFNNGLKCITNILSFGVIIRKKLLQDIIKWDLN